MGEKKNPAIADRFQLNSESLGSVPSLYAMVGRNPRSNDDSNSSLAHSEYRESTREILHDCSPCCYLLRQFAYSLLHCSTVVSWCMQFFWLSLCTHRELKLVYFHQMTSGFVLPSRIMSLLRLVGGKYSPGAHRSGETFSFPLCNRTVPRFARLTTWARFWISFDIP